MSQDNSSPSTTKNITPESRIQNPASISCIITNYNYAHFIKQAIDSALQQDQAFSQIIVIDDGSTDNSDDILQSYTDRITYHQQQNSGVVVARNKGAELATSEYICFLDADDTLQPNYVSQITQAITNNSRIQNPESRIQPPAFYYSDYQLMGQANDIIKANPWNLRKLLYRNYIMVPAAIAKTAFDQVGGFSAEVNTKISFEDWDLWLSLAAAGYQGLYIPQVLVNYRLHGHGRSRPALQQRQELEVILAQRHPTLYQPLTNRLYLSIFKTASRLRNKLKPAPGT